MRRRSVAGPATLPKRMDRVRSALAGAFDSSPFEGVDWSLSYLAFLVYAWTIITYKFQLGTASMSIALLTLPLEKKGLRMPLLNILMFALIGWALVGMMVTDYTDLVVEATTDFAKIGAVVFVGVNVLNTRPRIRTFIVLSIIEWGLFPIRGTMLSYFLMNGALQGRAVWNFIYSNPNDLAGLAILALSVALGMIAVEKRKWVQLGGRLAVGLLVLIIILTQSRGAFIALGAFALIGGKRFFANVKAILMVVVLVIGVVAIAPDSVWRRFSTIKDVGNADQAFSMDPDEVDLATRQDMSSSAQRLAIWKVAADLVAFNPLTGVGLGAYPEAHFQLVRNNRALYGMIAFGRRDTHSTYLNVAAETGVPGLCIFVALIATTLIRSRRARLKHGARSPALALQMFNLEVGLWGYAVAAIWGSYASMVPTYVHLMLMEACTHLLEESHASVPIRGAMKLSPREQQMRGVTA